MERDSFTWDAFWKSRKDGSFLGSFLYFLREKVWVKQFVEVALRHTKRGRVLEAGGGSCLSSIILRKQRGDNITGIDLNPHALDIAQQAAAKHNVKIKLTLGSIEKLDFLDGFFDLCWNSGTMEHFEDPKPVLCEMLRVGKRMIIIIPVRSIIWQSFLSFVGLFGKNFAAKFNEGYTKFYTEKEICSIFKEITQRSIVIEHIHLLGIFPYIAIIC